MQSLAYLWHRHCRQWHTEEQANTYTLPDAMPVRGSPTDLAASLLC